MASVGASDVMLCGRGLRVSGVKIGFYGPQAKCWSTHSSFQYRRRKTPGVRCHYGRFQGSSGGGGSGFVDEFVNSSVIEAVEVRSGSDGSGFIIKMLDGKNLKCVYNTPQELGLANYTPQHAIVLKMEDGSDLLLPIIVMEQPSITLMDAIRNVQLVTPTVYQVVNEMINKMQYTMEVVRVTKKVQDVYYAELLLVKEGNVKERHVIDLKPSDAINMAVSCKVPIQVSRHLVYSDGVRVLGLPLSPGSRSDGLLLTKLDRPDDVPCMEAIEFDLVRNMLAAVVEERYKDAAQYRDELHMFRAKRKNWI